LDDKYLAIAFSALYYLIEEVVSGMGFQLFSTLNIKGMFAVKSVKYTLLICILIAPQFAVSEGQEQHQYTDLQEINFALSTQVAFDRSGKQIVSEFLADGSILARNHGSLANITVARLGPDGQLETFCTTDADAAKAWMAGANVSVPATPQNTHVEEK
jgi:hypothetical protein